jgi:hypothetical protein
MDHRAFAAEESLLERGKPAAHRVERGVNWPGGDDPFNADRRGRLLSRKQDFMQPLAWPDADELDLDIAARQPRPLSIGQERRLAELHTAPH